MAALPEPWRSLRAEIEKINAAIKVLQNSASLEGTGLSTIDDGQVLNSGLVYVGPDGTLLVDGGSVIMLTTLLVEMFRLGVMEHGDRGIIIRREDDSIALEIRKAFGPSDPGQVIIVRDKSGRAIFAEALLSGSGIEVPHINLPFIPVDYSTAVAAAVTSTSFVATHEHRGKRQNPALKPELMVMCSDGSTSAEIQFYDVDAAAYLGGFGGSPAVQTITVPTGTTAFTKFELASGALQLPGSMSDPIHLQIHVKRTAGAGSVSVTPVMTFGSGF
jgi:hypothetical protein